MTAAVGAMLALGTVCWTFRVLFIVLVPADRLPDPVRQALGGLAPAVLASLVAVETDFAMRGSGVLAAVLVLVSVITMVVTARRTGSLLLAIAIGLGTALLIDLVLVA